MKTITPVELESLLKTQSDLALLDVRTPAEFAGVHVPQAHNVPLDHFDPGSLLTSGQLTQDKPVYLLCHSGARATKAAEKLAREGLDHGVVIEGGTQAWIKVGLPVDRGPGNVISLERQVRIGAGSFVLLGVLLAIFVHPYFIGLSAFVGTGLVFAGITDWCGMGLLLAKLPWNSR
jgi:rhodanese-related sulfurtransferase